jgi:hypothetical protein
LRHPSYWPGVISAACSKSHRRISAIGVLPMAHAREHLGTGNTGLALRDWRSGEEG